MAKKREDGKTKAEWLAEEVAKADFPIVPINKIASIEGNAGTPGTPVPGTQRPL